MKYVVIGVNKAAKVCEKITVILSVLLLVAMLGAIILGVYVRLFLNGGFVWTDEFSRWCLVDSAFIGAAVMIRKGSLVSLDVLVNKLQGRARIWMDLLIQVLCMVFVAVFLIQGYLSIPTYLGYTALTMPTNQAIPLVGMELGGALMLVFLLERLVNDLYTLTGGDLELALGTKTPENSVQGGAAK